MCRPCFPGDRRFDFRQKKRNNSSREGVYPLGVVPQPIVAPECDILWSYHVLPDGPGVVLCRGASRIAFVRHVRVREIVDSWHVQLRVTSCRHNCRKLDHHRVHGSLNVGFGPARLSPYFLVLQQQSRLGTASTSHRKVPTQPTTTVTDECMCGMKNPATTGLTRFHRIAVFRDCTLFLGPRINCRGREGHPSCDRFHLHTTPRGTTGGTAWFKGQSNCIVKDPISLFLCSFFRLSLAGG